jgi:TPR repeat protein
VKQRITMLCAGGVLACALFSVARAGPFEDAQAADQKADYATELQILRSLAEQGNALAQLGLGVMYAMGQGVPQDYAQAFVWYRKAAEQGDARAQFNLGLMYANSHGVPRDHVRAHMWFNIAAGASDASIRDLSVKWRDLVATRMTPAQIAEAQRIASEWKPK